MAAAAFVDDLVLPLLEEPSSSSPSTAAAADRLPSIEDEPSFEAKIASPSGKNRSFGSTRGPLVDKTNLLKRHSPYRRPSSGNLNAKRSENTPFITNYFGETKRREESSLRAVEAAASFLGGKLDTAAGAKQIYDDEDTVMASPVPTDVRMLSFSSPVHKAALFPSRPLGAGEGLRLFTGRNEHASPHIRRSQSGIGVLTPGRKRRSLETTDELKGESCPRSDRKRSHAIQLDDSTVTVDPDDDAFEAEHDPRARVFRSASPLSPLTTRPTAHALERTLSTTALELGRYSHKADTHHDVEEHSYSLSVLSAVVSQKFSVAYGSISGETLVDEWEKLGEEDFRKRYVLIDCRYGYEYEGGHVRGAININEEAKLEQMFFPKDEQTTKEKEVASQKAPSESANTLMSLMEEAAGTEEHMPRHESRIPIFYCEYSQKRGPDMAQALRRFDRHYNTYPRLTYAEVYVIDRGYRHLYTMFKQSTAVFSEPTGYVTMDSNPEELARHKNHKKQKRAQRPTLKQRLHSRTALGLASSAPPVSTSSGEDSSGKPKTTIDVTPSAGSRRAKMDARERIRISSGGRRAGEDRWRGVSKRLNFDSDDETPVAASTPADPPLPPTTIEE